MCLQKETAVLHDRVYQALGASSSPRPKFPFTSVGVKESHTPEPTAPGQPNQGAATCISSTTSTNVITSTQPNTSNPYNIMRVGGGGGGVMSGTTMTGGYPTQPVPPPGQPGQTSFGGGYVTPITQPLVSQGPAIMQPSADTYTPPSMPGIMQPGVPGVPQPPGGGVVSGSQPGRENTYPVDAPVTWNDPPAIVAKKVHICAGVPEAYKIL